MRFQRVSRLFGLRCRATGAFTAFLMDKNVNAAGVSCRAYRSSIERPRNVLFHRRDWRKVVKKERNQI